MKKAVLRYGLYSVVFITIFFLLDEWLIGDKLSFEKREIVGWVGIFLSTLFVYFGIRYYRDHYNNGFLGFGESIKVGLLIMLMPSVAFGIFNVIYVLLNPEFLDKYYQDKISQAKSSLPAAELAEALSSLEKERVLFGNPAVQFMVMFLSVFAIGLIVTVISTLILRRNRASIQTA
jgi:hypothetical protein